MRFEVVVVYDVVLVYARILIKPSWRICRLIDKVQEYFSCCMFCFVILAAVVYAIVMVVPDANYLGAVCLHFLIPRVFLLRFSILLCNMLHRLSKFTSKELASHGPCNRIRIGHISSPHKQIWSSHFLKYICPLISQAIARPPSYFQLALIFLMTNQVAEYHRRTIRIGESPGCESSKGR